MKLMTLANLKIKGEGLHPPPAILFCSCNDYSGKGKNQIEKEPLLNKKNKKVSPPIKASGEKAGCTGC